MTTLAPLPAAPPLAVADPDVERDQANYYAGRARSDATQRAYERDFAAFAAWCAPRGFCALPASPEAVARYVSMLAANGAKVASIGRYCASISVVHKRAGHTPSPTAHDGVREILRGIRRDLGTAQTKKAPLVTEDLRRVVDALDDSRAAIRDRAILLVGFAAALRRSEIVALDIEDVRFVRAGVEITIRRSKTDQEGHGAMLAVPYGSNLATCPVRALQAWIAAAGATTGPLFTASATGLRLRGRAVALMVKKRAERAGVEGDLSGHSLRAGFATSAADAGVSLVDSMRQTRHKSMIVASGYVRRKNAWDRNAAASVGL